MKNLVRDASSQPTPVTVDGLQQSNSQWRQYWVAILVNGLAFIAGTTYGWPATILPVLQSESTPVGDTPITDTDASWLASVFCITRIIMLPFYMYIIDRYGCKITGYLVGIPLILSYVMLLFANSMNMLLSARLIVGISAGGIGILGPSYTIDIAEDSNKGKLNMIYSQALNIGVTFSYVIGYYTPYFVFHVICIALTVTFTVAHFWLPESPLFLMISGKTEEAKEVLKWLRNGNESEFEIVRMKFRAQKVLEKRRQKMTLSQMTDRRMLRGLFICLGLTTNQQLTGIASVMAFTVVIFQQAGAAIPPNITTIILGVLMILGTHVSSITIERYGRRVLLISSDVTITLCLFVMGTYFYVQFLGWNLDLVGWLPIAAMAVYILSTGVGVGVLPYTIATELVHPNYRTFVQAANMMMLSVSTFTVSMTFIPLINVMGQYGCFWLYALCSAVGSVCIYLFVPETKGRSIEDVLEQMGSDNFVHSILHYKSESRDIVNKNTQADITTFESEKV